MARSKGIPMSETQKAHLSAVAKLRGFGKWLIGKKQSQETIEKRRLSRDGYRHSEETKRKIGIAHKGKKVSVEARKKMSLSKAGKKRKPHTEETKKILSLKKKGALNPMYGKPVSEARRLAFLKISTQQNAKNWISDRTKLKKYEDANKNRRSPAYKEWRKRVWLRDNFMCKIANPDCAGRIEVHHILGYTEYPELRYEINNGITLCHAHHPRKRAEEKRLSPYFQELVSASKILL